MQGIESGGSYWGEERRNCFTNCWHTVSDPLERGYDRIYAKYVQIRRSYVHLPPCVQKCTWPFRKTIQVYNQNSFLIQGLICLALNTVVLAGRLFKEIPQQATNGALLGLSFVGILTIPEQCMNLLKTTGDLARAVEAAEPVAVVMTAIKVFREASGILLVLSHLFAVSVSFAGKKEWTANIYWVMGWWGLLCTLLSPVVELYRQASCSTMRAKIERIDNAYDREECIQRLLLTLKGQEKFEGMRPLSLVLPSRASVIRVLYRRGWKAIQGDLGRMSQNSLRNFTIEDREHMEAIFERLKRQVDFAETLSWVDQLLVELGYMAMLIGNLYMGKWQQAFTTWVMSLLYNTRSVYFRVAEIGTRYFHEHFWSRARHV